jgi:TonB family protein
MVRKKIAVLLPSLAFLLAPGAAPAQEAPQQPAPPAQAPAPHLFGGVEPMANDQLKVVDLLRAGKWREAQPVAHRQFLVAAGYADQYPGVVAVALALDALADAGLGHEAPAICRWNAAQRLAPSLLKADLAAFGAPGALFQSHPLKAPQSGGKSPEDLPQLSPKKNPAGEVHAPEYIFRLSPEYPPEARHDKQEGKVVVEAIIEKDGSVSSPRVLEHQPLGLDASALYAICGWRFKPATLKGEPVRVYYTLTVNFKVEKK